MKDEIKGAFFGAAIGDALGVPVEFSSRAALQRNPVVDFRGYGVWNQPPGTFSDDSSTLFCTAESLCNGYDVQDMAERFIRWSREGYWGAHDAVFDIGGATRAAISRLLHGTSPALSGGMMEHDNGNGSLMRIIPIAFLLRTESDVAMRYDVVKQVSSITHAHFRSVLVCFIYIEFAIALLHEADKQMAYARMQKLVNAFIADKAFAPAEVSLFDRVLQENIAGFGEDTIRSSGYVLDTLESSLWCFLQAATYEKAVLTAVNLGGDTDTTATVAGGLAGLHYGYEAIPTRWVQGLAKRDAIAELAARFAQRYQ